MYAACMRIRIITYMHRCIGQHRRQSWGFGVRTLNFWNEIVGGEEVVGFIKYYHILCYNVKEYDTRKLSKSCDFSWIEWFVYN